MSSSTANLRSFFGTSIGRKQLVAITGLALVGFLKAHLVGNFLLLAGPEAFNMYAHQLTSTPIIYIAEAILIALFLTHIGLAAKLTLENKAARPVKYAKKKPTGRGTTFASNTMPFTGLIILVFLVLHLMNFKYGTEYYVTYDGLQVRDLFRTVIEYFANPYYVAWYVFAMLAMATHLAHGVQSALQTVGFNSAKYTPMVKTLGKLLAFGLAAGFSGLSVWCHFQVV